MSTTTLHSEKTKTLVPQLRFQEFDCEWENKKLGKLGNFIGGGTPSTTNEDFWKGNIPWISSSDIYENDLHNINIYRYLNDLAIKESATKIIPKNSILLVSRVGVGKLAINKVELCTSQDFSNFLPLNDDSYFIGYYLLANKQLLVSFSQGTSIKGFTTNDIKDLKIAIPTLPEQQKIASFLSAVDEKIQQLTRKATLLEQYKKGVMQQLFSGKLRFKDENGKDYPDWEEKKVQELINEKAIISLLDGNHGALYPKSEEFTSKGVPYIAANNLLNGKVKFSDCKFLPIERAKKFKKGIAKNGDVLFAHNATVGPTALLITELDYVILSTTVTYYRCDVKILSNNYLLHYFNSDNFINQYTRVMSQSTRNQVPITMQKKFSIDFPCLEEQQKIANFLSGIDSKIESVNQQLAQTQTFKKGLLQQMFV
jgi:type I restriction enzyme S subunit